MIYPRFVGRPWKSDITLVLLVFSQQGRGEGGGGGKATVQWRAHPRCLGCFFSFSSHLLTIWLRELVRVQPPKIQQSFVVRTENVVLLLPPSPGEVFMLMQVEAKSVGSDPA